MVFSRTQTHWHTQTSSLDCPELPQNSQCDSAVVVSQFPFIDSGSNEGGRQVSGEALNCPAIRSTFVGVWYKLIGHGSCVTASLELSDFDTALAVYVGPSCDELHCVNQNLDVDIQYTQNISWQAMIGMTYYIFVGSDQNNEVTFRLSLSSVRKSNRIVPQYGHQSQPLLLSTFSD
jgi:hypothetical protein